MVHLDDAFNQDQSIESMLKPIVMFENEPRRFGIIEMRNIPGGEVYFSSGNAIRL
jgi:hypothetical protein